MPDVEVTEALKIGASLFDRLASLSSWFSDRDSLAFNNVRRIIHTYASIYF